MFLRIYSHVIFEDLARTVEQAVRRCERDVSLAVTDKKALIRWNTCELKAKGPIMPSFQVTYNNETTRQYHLYELRLLHTTSGATGLKEQMGEQNDHLHDTIFPLRRWNLAAGHWYQPNVQTDSSGNASGLDSTNPLFDYRMGHWLSWPVCPVFSSVSKGKCRKIS